METLANVLLYGLLLGGVYALMAFGLGLIYGVMRLVNLAHGTVLMLAAYAAYTLNSRWGLDPIAALVLVFPLSYLVGVALYLLLLRRITGRSPMASMLLLFGVGLCGRNLAYLLWTGDDRAIPLSYGLSTVSLGITIPLIRLIVFGVAVLATILLYLLLQHSQFGRALRAVAQDPLAAELSGVSVERTNAHAFGVGTAIGALGGVLLSTLYVINPELGAPFLLKSFCIIVLGGMDHMAGILFGAAVLGLAETATGVYGSAALQEAVSFILLVVILVVLPGGLPSLKQRVALPRVLFRRPR